MVFLHLQYHLLRSISAFRHFLQTRVTPAGRLTFAGLVAFAVFGLDTNRNVSYQGFTLLLALLLTSFAALRLFRAHLSISRFLPRIGTVGEMFHYRLLVKNQGSRALQDISLVEQFADPRPSYEDYRNSFKAGNAQGKRWLDNLSYGHWQRLWQNNQQAEASVYPLPLLRAGAETELHMSVRPLQRGRLFFPIVKAIRPDIFGLFVAKIVFPLKESILIIPKRYPVPHISLPGSRAYQQGGVVLATSVADAEEFQSLREYRPGDPLRLIHWKSWAKIGKPVIKEFQDEYFVRHALILDTFTTSFNAAIFEEAVAVAASFACTVETRDSLLDLMFVGTEAYCETIGRGHGPVERLLEVLAGVQPCPDRPFVVLRRLVMERRQSICGCICLLLSWDQERKNFIDHLITLGIPVLVCVITDPHHTNIPAYRQEESAAWLHLLETGRIAEGLASL